MRSRFTASEVSGSVSWSSVSASRALDAATSRSRDSTVSAILPAPSRARPALLRQEPFVGVPATVGGGLHEARQGEAAQGAGAEEQGGLPTSEVGDDVDEFVDAALPECLRDLVNARHGVTDVRRGLRQDALDAFGDAVERLRDFVHLLGHGGLALIDDAKRRVLRLGGEGGRRGLRLLDHIGQVRGSGARCIRHLGTSLASCGRVLHHSNAAWLICVPSLSAACPPRAGRFGLGVRRRTSRFGPAALHTQVDARSVRAAPTLVVPREPFSLHALHPGLHSRRRAWDLPRVRAHARRDRPLGPAHRERTPQHHGDPRRAPEPRGRGDPRQEALAMLGAIGLILFAVAALAATYGQDRIAGLAPKDFASLAALTALALLFTGWMIDQFRGRWRQGFSALLLWAVVFAGLTGGYAYR